MDFKLLSKYGISHLDCGTARSAKEAEAVAKKIGFPVALKIISPSVLHKTDRGGVELNIGNAQELRKAYTAMMERFSDVKVDGVLVQRMASPGGVELIVGGKRDLQFGQMIMLGIGGIYVEVVRDFTFRICPITKEDAQEMIAELHGYKILSGARGKKPINKGALVATLLKVSALLEKENPKEFDINPLVADGKGCIAVDVRVIG